MAGLHPGAATMTVVFTDLVGSTAIRSALGDDRADTLRREHDELLARLVDEHRGVVVKGTGDGIMAVFHAPSEALAAVVEIQHRIASRNRRSDVPLSLRIGLSIGEVRIEGDDVFGTPVVESARLCNAADDDQILASAHVKALAGSRSPVGWNEVGELDLKGLSEQLMTYEVRWWDSGAARPMPFPVVPGLSERAPFLGRNLERFALADAWARARSQRGPVVLIGGEAGVGKTRLAVHFARSAHDEGSIVLHGRCREDVSPPYEPFIEALRTHLAGLSDSQIVDSLGASPDELVRLVPELEGRVARSTLPEVGPEVEALRLHEAVAGWLAAASKVEPIVLLIDDLHWAGASTLAMLRHVLLTTSPMRVLVLATFRESDLDVNRALSSFMDELRQSPRGVEQMRLEGLDESESRRLVDALMGDVDDDPELVRTLTSSLNATARGNPLYLDHAVRHLRETDQLLGAGTEGGKARLDVAEDMIEVPLTMAGTIAGRLGHLDEAVASTLRVASVLGQEIDLGVLRALLGVDEPTLVEAVEAAVGSGFLNELSEARFGFSHSLVREVIYESTAVRWRVAVHRRAAEEIERQSGTRKDAHVLELAHHFVEAAADGDVAKGIDYAISAARRLSEQLAFADARRWYRSALRLHERASQRDDALRLDLLVGRGQAEALAGRDSSRDTLIQAAELALRLGDSAAMLQATLAMRIEPMFAPLKEDTDHLRTLRQALGVIGEGDPAIRARLLAMTAFELSFFPDRSGTRSVPTLPSLPTDPAALADEALGLAQSGGDRRVLMDVLQLRIPSIDAPSTLEDRVQLSEQLFELAAQLDEPVSQFRAAHFRVQCCLEAGEVDAADEWIAQARALLRRLHLPVPAYVLSEDIAQRMLLVGDLEDAESEADQRHRLAKVVGRGDRPEHLAFLLSLRLQQGRRDEVDELTARLSELPAEWMGCTAVRALAEAGRIEDARERYGELAERDDKALGVLPRSQGVTASNMAFLAALFGDAAGAQRWYPVLVPHAERLARGATMLHCGAHHLGMLAAVLGRDEEAHEWFEIAVTVHTRASASLLVAETQLEWARFCSAVGQQQRARDLATQAQASATQKRSRGLEGQARQLLNALTRGSRRVTMGAPAPPLFPR